MLTGKKIKNHNMILMKQSDKNLNDKNKRNRLVLRENQLSFQV